MLNKISLLFLRRTRDVLIRWFFRCMKEHKTAPSSSEGELFIKIRSYGTSADAIDRVETPLTYAVRNKLSLWVRYVVLVYWVHSLFYSCKDRRCTVPTAARSETSPHRSQEKRGCLGLSGVIVAPARTNVAKARKSHSQYSTRDSLSLGAPCVVLVYRVLPPRLPTPRCSRG